MLACTQTFVVGPTVGLDSCVHVCVFVCDARCSVCVACTVRCARLSLCRRTSKICKHGGASPVPMDSKDLQAAGHTACLSYLTREQENVRDARMDKQASFGVYVCEITRKKWVCKGGRSER
jgi:hypothetical protein